MRKRIAVVWLSIVMMLNFIFIVTEVAEPVRGAVYYVGGVGPGNYTKIQDAVNASSDRDTIYVFSGIYHENIKIRKSITLIGQGKTTTEIEGDGTKTVVEITEDDVSISGFKISKSGEYYAGVRFWGADYGHIADCEVTNSYTGIHFWGSSYCIIKDNVCKYNTDQGIFLHGSSYGIIKDNVCKYNSRQGIFLHGAGDNLIENNQCISNGYEGLWIFGKDNNIVINNIFNSNGDGILFSASSNNLIENNSCDSNIAYGIHLASASYNKIKNNSFNSNAQGILFWGSAHWNIIENNSANSNMWAGINIHRSNNNTVVGNIMKYNDVGIDLWIGSEYNIIYNNTISDSARYGIWIRWNDFLGPSGKCRNNIFYHNNILINTEQVNDTFPMDNNWHHPILLEGNYWSDYTGLDDGSGSGKHAIAGDGIGDTLIPHPFLDYDFYPFVHESGWNEPHRIPPVADAGPDQTVLINDVVFLNGSNSYDPDGQIVSYEWDFGDGSAVGLGKTTTHAYNATGIYAVTLTVTDDDGLTDTDTCTITVIFPSVLSHGWNLISIPLVQTDTELATVLQSIAGEYDAVQRYDAWDDRDHWKHNHLSKPEYLNDLKEVDHTMGIWIHITKPGGTTLFPQGYTPAVPQTIDLHTGWNLVGYPSLYANTCTAALNNLRLGTDVDAVWTFDSNLQQWEEVGSSDYFDMGRGYWIHVKMDCVWEIPTDIPSS